MTTPAASLPLFARTDLAGPWRLPAKRRDEILAAAGTLTVNRIFADKSAATTRDWLRALAEALALPAWFGANFDALYDMLCDREIVGGSDRLLLIENLNGLREDDVDTLIAVLQAAADEWRDYDRRLWALFAVDDIDLDPLPKG